MSASPRALVVVAASCTVVVLAIAAASVDAQAPASKFALGVLRRDGIVVPFAAFDGKRWRRDWPAPREAVEVPAHVRDVPSRWWGGVGPIESWQILVGAQTPRTIQVRQPDWFDAHCVKQIGLRTDYRPAVPPPGREAQPYPKDGLAVWPPQRIEPIDVLPGASATDPVVAAFNAAEAKEVKNEERGRWSHPFTMTQRELMPLTIEAAYAFGDPARTRVYYFEVSKQYGRDGPRAAPLVPLVDRVRPQPDCATVSFGAGWFVRDGNGPLRSIGFEAALVGCNRYGIRYMLPLGAIRIAGRLFWIAQWSGWDFEEYSVVEIKEKTFEDVVRAWGGGC